MGLSIDSCQYLKALRKLLAGGYDTLDNACVPDKYTFPERLHPPASQHFFGFGGEFLSF